MTIILGLIKLLGSAGFGTIFGGLMGLLNRKADLKAKQADQAHELAMRDKDAAIMAQEWAARAKVAQVEGEALVEGEAYEALGKSYEFAQPDKGTNMAAFSTFVRPFISLGYFLITSAGSAYIIYYAFQVAQIKLTTDQLFELTMFVISWIAFMGGATIGWWFAMRPGKQPPTLNLR
jgi:hypothetical protein